MSAPETNEGVVLSHAAADETQPSGEERDAHAFRRMEQWLLEHGENPADIETLTERIRQFVAKHMPEGEPTSGLFGAFAIGPDGDVPEIMFAHKPLPGSVEDAERSGVSMMDIFNQHLSPSAFAFTHEVTSSDQLKIVTSSVAWIQPDQTVDEFARGFLQQNPTLTFLGAVGGTPSRGIAHFPVVVE